MGGHTFEDGGNFAGRDPRAEILLDAAKRVAEVQQKLDDANKELKNAEAARREAYSNMVGETIVTEGDIMYIYDNDGRAQVLLTSEVPHLSAQRVEILEAVRDGLRVVTAERHVVQLSYDSIHHPQLALPEDDIQL